MVFKNDVVKVYFMLLFNSGYVSWARQEDLIFITALRGRTIIILILQLKK